MNTSRGLVPTSVLRLSIAYAVVFSLTTSLLVGLLYVYAVRALDRGTDEIIDAELQVSPSSIAAAVSARSPR